MVTRAEVTLKLTPTDFQLIISSLENELDIAREEVKDHALPMGSDEWKEMNQNVLHLEALLRMLK